MPNGPTGLLEDCLEEQNCSDPEMYLFEEIIELIKTSNGDVDSIKGLEAEVLKKVDSFISKENE
jgi:hypothetical protein